jgi:hypothetical protein
MVGGRAFRAKLAGLEGHRALLRKVASDPEPVLSRPIRPAPAQERSVTGAADLRIRVTSDNGLGTRVGAKTSGGLFRTVQLDRGRAMERTGTGTA